MHVIALERGAVRSSGGHGTTQRQQEPEPTWSMNAALISEQGSQSLAVSCANSPDHAVKKQIDPQHPVCDPTRHRRSFQPQGREHSPSTPVTSPGLSALSLRRCTKRRVADAVPVKQFE